MSKLCGVYMIRSRSTGKFYYGSSLDCKKRKAAHLRALRAGTHHSIKLQRFFSKYGEDDLRFIMIEQCDRDAAYEAEAVLLSANAANPLSLNVALDACGGDNLTNNPRRKQIIKRIQRAIQARMAAMTPEGRVATFGRPGKLNGMFGRTHTAEARTIIGKRHAGNTYNLGLTRSEEVREKYRQAAQKRAADPEYVNAFAGKTHSVATRKRLSKIAKERVGNGILPSNTRRVKVGKRTYHSLSEAARQLGVVAATVLNRIRSENYPEYSYLD